MSSKRARITDATLKSLKPAPAGKRINILDDILPGFLIQVTDKGQASYYIYARFGGQRAPSRRKIDKVGAISLADARARAREQLEAARAGRDPKAEERAAELVKQGRVTVSGALEHYIAKRVRQHRRAKDTERELRTYVGAVWGDRPLEEITRGDVVKLVEAIAARGAKRQAHNILGLCKTFFAWCVETHRVKVSPCADIRGSKILGEKRPRQRVLNDAELAAVWHASDKLREPWRSFFRLLILTGARKSEVSDARWSEFDLDGAVWTIPPERFKSDATHVVPLSPAAVELLQELPHGDAGDFVFSTRDGALPIDGFSKAKAALDKLVELELKAKIDPWQIHDLRRTMRTGLSKLRISSEVAELTIGHALPTLHRVYDQHAYADERREALALWAGRLRDIVTPAPANVSQFERRARA
jgi:integrase